MIEAETVQKIQDLVDQIDSIRLIDDQTTEADMDTERGILYAQAVFTTARVIRESNRPLQDALDEIGIARTKQFDFAAMVTADNVRDEIETTRTSNEPARGRTRLLLSSQTVANLGEDAPLKDHLVVANFVTAPSAVSSTS